MNIVVAVDENWGIGLRGTQNVVIPEDRRHFREVTGHGTIIVGQRTLMDFPGGKPLKNRKNIVMSDDPAFTAEGAVVVHSLTELEKALRDEEDEDNVFVCGGGSIYRLLLPYTRYAYLTMLAASPEADTYFPNLDLLPNWAPDDLGEELESGEIRYRFVRYKNSDVLPLPTEE